MKHGLVDWREWGREAFDEAGASGRLVLLDISAVWCHWCHVMDDTTYSDGRVAEIINSRFVPVRVDTDRMPDVNERYNMGGWPTTAILTPTGEALVGATYVTPDKMVDTLLEIDRFHSENKDTIAEKIRELRERVRSGDTTDPAALSSEIVEHVLGELSGKYDPAHGGFGTEPKFPAPDAVDLLLTVYNDTNRRELLDMAKLTLGGMSSYGMYDQVEGGFFRYSVTRDWTIPHYEKLLDVNAGIVVNLLNTYRADGDPAWLDIVRGTLKYIDDNLWDRSGYFHASQDADEVYYKKDAVGRGSLRPPFIDKTLFTNVNARAAYAYLSAWEVTKEKRYHDHALAALNTIITKMKAPGGGFFHYFDNGPKRAGLLADQSAVIRTLLYAYRLTSDKVWLEEALGVVEYLRRTHWDAGSGGYHDLPLDKDAVAALAYRTKPMAENAELAVSLTYIGVLTGDTRYLDMAKGCLDIHAMDFDEFSYMAAGYALAVYGLLKETGPEAKVCRGRDCAAG